ncbi:MAG TPA: DUF1150 family protein [Rhizomicrobium sp.]|jgi:hypothetical protein|nr:DUF1150 family protein [Rhizomicrobium sp.]
MTDVEEFYDGEDEGFDPARIAYIKPTGTEEARKLGIVPPGIQLPPGATLYVLHSIDGTVLGYTDSWDGAYGAAVQNELTPVSVH